MAESNEGWLGSWFSAAKNKGSEVFEFVKKDLGEFGLAVKAEATNVVSSTGSVLEKTLGLNEPESTASSVKRSISSFLGQVNEALNPSPEDDDAEPILITDGDIVPLTKLQKAVYDLQRSASTFLTDPDEHLKQRYECWLEIIDDQLSEQKVSKHLSSSTVLNEQFKNLVPEHVTSELFWKRYLFKKALIEDDIAMQEVSAKKETKDKDIKDDDLADLNWEHEDFVDDIELTEEEQIKLIEQYEQEKNNEMKKQRKKDELVVFEKSPKKNPSKESLGEKKNATNNSNSSTDDDWEKISDLS